MESQYAARGQAPPSVREYYSNAGSSVEQTSGWVPLITSNVQYVPASKSGGSQHTSAFGNQMADTTFAGIENLRVSQGYGADRESLRSSHGYSDVSHASLERESLRNSQGYSDASRERENLRNLQGHASKATDESKGFLYIEYMQQQPQQQRIQVQQQVPPQPSSSSGQQYRNVSSGYKPPEPYKSADQGKGAPVETIEMEQQRGYVVDTIQAPKPQPYKSAEEYRADQLKRQLAGMSSDKRIELQTARPAGFSGSEEEAALQDEVKRLRTSLATTTAELGRQIELYQLENTAGQQARVDWLQKLLVQQEAKVVLLESEVKANSKDRTMTSKGVEFATVQALRGQVESLEKQNQVLKDQHNKLLYEQQYKLKSSSGFIAQLEEKVRHLARERDSLNAQLDDMMTQGKDKAANDPLLVSRLKEAEAHSMQLKQQSVVLAEDRDSLRVQLEAQMRYLNLDKESASKELKEAHKEIISLKTRLMQQQSTNDEDKGKIAARYAAENAAAMMRLQDLEQQHAGAMKQLEETQGKNQVLDEQLQSMRSHMLYSLLKTLDNRWMKRFYKNHFMAWRFLYMQRKKQSSEIATILKVEGLANILQKWLHHVQETKAVSVRAAELHVRHSSKMEELRSNLEAQLDDTQKALRSELDETRTVHAAQVHALELERAEVRSMLEGEVATIKDQWDVSVRALEKERDELKSRLEAEILSVRQQWETSIKELAALATDEKEALEKSAANTLKAELQRASEELARVEQQHGRELDELAESHAREIQDAKETLDRANAAHEQVLKEATKAKEDALAEAQKDFERVCADFEEKMKHEADVHAISIVTAAKERERLHAQHQEALDKMDEQMAKLKESHVDEIASVRAQNTSYVSAARAECELDMQRATKVCAERIEEIQAAHAQEIALLKEDAAELESNLRAQMVAEKAKVEQEAEEARCKYVKKEEDMRKRILEKDKEIARNLEQAEMERQKVVEDGEEELQKVQKEYENKLDEMRVTASRAQDEMRHKIQFKEKEYKAKLEALRAENIAAQEQFQMDLEQKEESFRKKLDQEKSLQAQMDNLLSSGSIRELQAKIAGLQKDLERAEQDKAEMVAQEGALRKQISAVSCDMQNKDENVRALKEQEEYLEAKVNEQQIQIEDRIQREKRLETRLEETSELLRESKQMQSDLMRQVEASAEELEQARRRCAATEDDGRKRCSDMEDQLRQRCCQLEQDAKQAQWEVSKVQAEKAKLSEELREASQALLKRGDDFSESVRLLQGRFEAADQESRDLGERLKMAHNTNARLAAELEDASAMLQKYTDKNRSTCEAEEVLKGMLEMKQRELLQAEHNYNERLNSAQKANALAQAELQEELARVTKEAEERVQEAQASCFMQVSSTPPSGYDAGMELQEVWKRLERTERENNTLTDELDNCLAENAQLRNELDTLRSSSPTTNSRDDDGSSRASSSYGVQRLNHLRSSFSELFGSRSHTPTTCGVHTYRLKKNVFEAWIVAALEARMGGQTPMFSGLEHFQAQNGSLAPWFPVGRIRKSELEVRADKLGSGSFAEVFKGEWKIPVAVKKMRGNTQHKELLEFVREGEMLRCLSHPCIVKLMGVFHEGQTFSLVQECVNGVNMFDFLHKYHHSVSIEKQLGIALQICDALAYIHSFRIVHRDVKPQNVIYEEKTGTAKLCDFGLARLMPKGVEELDSESLGTGGTPAYQAPEVLRRKHCGRKLDQYGFAVTLWEMYTRKLPWSDCNLEQMTHKVSGRNERPPIPQEMPRDYAETISSCWRTDPASRPEFSDLIPALTLQHTALSGGLQSSGRSSASSLGAVSTASTQSSRSVTQKAATLQPLRTTGQPGSVRNAYTGQQQQSLGSTSIVGHMSSKFVPGSYAAF